MCRRPDVYKITRVSFGDKPAGSIAALALRKTAQMSEEELAGCVLEQLIGKNCQLQIVHAPRDNGGVFCNIQAIVPAPKGVIKLRAADDYVRVQDRPTRNGNGHTAPASVPDDDEVPF